ncbi:unnamed protein product [Prunus armeniaca]
MAVQTHPGLSNATAASSQQYGQSNPTFSTVRPFQQQHITGVVISIRLPPLVRFGHSNSNTCTPRSNLRRLSGAARLGRNGRTPGSSRPADKATKQGATSSAAGCCPARSGPSGTLIRRRPVNDRGRL